VPELSPPRTVSRYPIGISIRNSGLNAAIPVTECIHSPSERHAFYDLTSALLSSIRTHLHRFTN
jgi:hypothetical protein